MHENKKNWPKVFMGENFMHEAVYSPTIHMNISGVKYFHFHAWKYHFYGLFVRGSWKERHLAGTSGLPLTVCWQP